MTILKVSVKWSGKKFDDVPLDVTKPARDFKEQLYKLTQVEPEKQKIMIKGGMLKVIPLIEEVDLLYKRMIRT
jgi:ubiquitin carboxyl-terminal hydrolase 14